MEPLGGIDLTSQKVGRLGELAVESALTERGWLVGNFNSSVTNAAAYVLFAVKGSDLPPPNRSMLNERIFGTLSV